MGLSRHKFLTGLAAVTGAGVLAPAEANPPADAQGRALTESLGAPGRGACRP